MTGDIMDAEAGEDPSTFNAVCPWSLRNASGIAGTGGTCWLGIGSDSLRLREWSERDGDRVLVMLDAVSVDRGMEE